jgi:CHAD domain-containing protein
MTMRSESVRGRHVPSPARPGSADELERLADAVLGPASSVTPAVQRSLAAPTLRLIALDDVIKQEADPEAIHQARIATRRLRANLGTLRALMQPEVAQRLRFEFSWLGGALGAVRDLDVLQDRFGARTARLASHDNRATERLLAGLVASRAEAHDALMEMLRSSRYDELIRASSAAVIAVPESDELAADAFRPLMNARWTRLRRAFEGLTPGSSDEQLHAARIATKRARYAAEAFEPVYGDRARKFVRRATAVQDVLGEHQDAVASQEWLRRKASRSTSAAAFVAGQLAAQEERARARARSSWPDAWRALARPGVRFWT